MRIDDDANIKGGVQIKDFLNIERNLNLLTNANSIFDLNFKDKMIHVVEFTDAPAEVNLTLSEADEQSLILRIIFIQGDIPTKINLPDSFFQKEKVAISVQPNTVSVVDFVSHSEVFYQVGGFIDNNSYSEDTDYTSEYFVKDGDTYTQAISKFDELIRRLIPKGAQTLETISWVPNLVLRSGITASTGTPSDAILLVGESLKLKTNVKFSDAQQNTLDLNINGALVGSVALTSGDDTGNLFEDSSISLLVVSNNSLDDFNRELEVLVTVKDFPVSDVLNVITLKMGTLTSPAFSFVVDQPTALDILPVGEIVAPTIDKFEKISGIPFFIGSDVQINARFDSVTGKFYKKNIGSVKRNAFLNVSEIIVPDNTILPEGSITPNILATSTVTELQTGSIFANITGKNLIGEETETSFPLLPTNRILLDKVSNKTFPNYDHSLALNGSTKQIMLLYGMFSYPLGDWSDVEAGDGNTLAGLNYESISDDRYLEFPINVSQVYGIEIDFKGVQVGFSDSGIEQSEFFDIEVHLDNGKVLKGNKSYTKFGTVPNTNDGIQDQNVSTKQTKYLFIGRNHGANLANVRIILKKGSTHQFSQEITVNPKNY